MFFRNQLFNYINKIDQEIKDQWNHIIINEVVNVNDDTDGDQQKMMINFLVKSFDMEILRQTVQDSVEETVRAKMQRSRSSLV